MYLSRSGRLYAPRTFPVRVLEFIIFRTRFGCNLVFLDHARSRDHVPAEAKSIFDQ